MRLLIIAGGLVLLSAVFLGIAAKETADQNRYQNAPAARAVAEVPRELQRLQVRRIGLSTRLRPDVTGADLRIGAGHIPGTAMPAIAGNVGLAGHRDTDFRPLRNIVAGDDLELETSGGVFHYRVTNTLVTRPNDVSVLSQTADARLTLVTCYPFSYIGKAPKRFIVQARLRHIDWKR